MNVRFQPIAGNPIIGILRPVRGLSFSLTLDSSDDFFLLSLESWLMAGNRRISEGICEEWPVPNPPISFIRAKSDPYLRVLFPLSSETVSTLEKERTGDLVLDVNFRISGQESAQGRSIVFSALPLRARISQSDWLGHLESMRWNDSEIIEIAWKAVKGNPKLAEGVDFVARASNAFRSGDYDTCMARIYKAFESVAKQFGEGDKKAGFETLWALTADPPIAAFLDSAVSAMGTLANYISRHAQAPCRNPSREEAHLMLTISSAIFSFVAERIAKTKGE